MNQDKISKLIKDLRKKNNLTQNEFAKEFNVTYQAVSKWENGKNLPDINVLKEICDNYLSNVGFQDPEEFEFVDKYLNEGINGQ